MRWTKATTRDGWPSAGISQNMVRNVKQNDPRMPPNPYVGYYGVAWLNGFESEPCAATSRLIQARADSASIEEQFRLR